MGTLGRRQAWARPPQYTCLVTASRPPSQQLEVSTDTIPHLRSPSNCYQGASTLAVGLVPVFQGHSGQL